MKPSEILLLLSLLACSNFVPRSSARSNGELRKHYVAVTGSDFNIGSNTSPWRTIQHAADSVRPGDTVVVRDGTYREAIAMTRGGSSSAPVVIRAENKWGATIAPSGGGNLIYFSHVEYVTLQNFEIIGNATDNAIIKIDVGQHNSIIGNKIHGSAVSSTECLSGGAVVIADSFATVRGNIIYDIGPTRSARFRCNQQHGIYVTGGENGVIQNNIILETWQGVALHLYSHGFSNWTVTNNTLVNNGDAAHNSGGAILLGCLGTTVCDNNVFNNNILAYNQRYAFYEDAQDSTGKFGARNLYQNNLIYRNALGNAFVTGVDTGTVGGDPLFVKYTGDETSDFHLQGNSPAIGRGTRHGAPSIDFDEMIRPQEIDIGASQYRKQ